MPITRVNLCLAPAPSVASGPSWIVPAGWAPSSALHATLPRQTGWAGTAAGYVYTAAAPVVPGRTYVASVSIRSIAANAGELIMSWIDAKGNEIAFTSTAYSQAVNTTARLSTAALVCPAAAIACRLVVEVDGSAQLTAAMVEQTAVTGAAYFDGAGPDVGARWAGTAGASMSVVGTTALAPDVAYDDSVGRVRILATGTPPQAGRVAVSRRLANAATFTAVRGEATTFGTTAARSVDDYEFPASEALVYRLESHAGVSAFLGASTGNLPIAPIDTLDVAFTPPFARGWLKFVAAPQFNRKVTVVDWGDVERPARNAVYEVQGRTDPVVVTAGHGSRRFPIVLRTWSPAETAALDESLRQGIPGFLHMPDDPDHAAPPSLYCVFGTYRQARPSRRSTGRLFDIPLIEVAPPPPSIFAPGSTYQTVLTGNATYTALAAAQASYLKVLST